MGVTIRIFDEPEKFPPLENTRSGDGIDIVTNFPIAYESFDHIQPHGTANDNLHNPRWVNKMIERFGPDMKYCDLGTSGGGLVKDFLDRGVLAVGVDGSDYSKRHQRAEWATIPDYLFTGNIAKPWSFIVPSNSDGQAFTEVKFDLITSFDVLEHINEDEIPDVIKWINRNLKVDGYTLHSIAEFPDPGYHVTLYPADWWIRQFEKHGFVREEIIEEQEYARISSHNLTFRKVRNV
jgi:cyclopropane fatty-acyl-phospholipid synthase-like methyltransferase